MASSTIDSASLRSACVAIAASDFSIYNRIKSILQVAHEFLGTSSIVAYAYNRVTRELDIVAMPGASQRELMRGPTDKIVFYWEKPGEGDTGKYEWVETGQEYDQYLIRLARINKIPGDKISKGDFRARETAKHDAWSGQKGRLALAKVYLWKGRGQTDDEVGQIFFNFYSTTDSPVFTDEMRNLIKFVSTVVRELLIESLYHSEPPLPRWTPEVLVKEINSVFDSPALQASMSGIDIERKVADIVCQAALHVTDNYGGRADFVLLIGDQLGRMFPGRGTDYPPQAVFIPTSWVSYACISSGKYFIGRYDSSRAEPKSKEFDPVSCKSLMIAPVRHEGEVRAVIRLSSPRQNAFLDAHARATQNLEQFARYGILCLDEYRQRKQMAAALDFYTGVSNPADVVGLLQRVVSALGAEWGTFWAVPWEADDRTPISQGIHLTADAHSYIRADDPNYGIRASDAAGFTRALLRHHETNPDVFFALQVLRSSWQGDDTGLPSYYLQVFSRCPPPTEVSSAQLLGDGFHRYASTDLDGITLNPNTSQAMHTRVAFLVRDGETVRAIIWLKFPDVREISWWERHFIDGLSNSLGKLMQVYPLHLAIKSFRHMIPGISYEADSTIVNLMGESKDDGMRARLDKIRSYTLALRLKAAEVKTLLSPLEQGEGAAEKGRIFPRHPIGDMCARAIDLGCRFKSRKPWKVILPEELRDLHVSDVFFSAMHNLCRNVVVHGWKPLPVSAGAEHAVVWIRQNGNLLYTTIANNGAYPESDPFSGPLTLTSQEQGGGLRLVKALLQHEGGTIELLGPEDFWARHPEAPADCATCEAFFEFSVPMEEAV